MTFRVQPAVITRICDGCRTESDPVDCPVLLDQGWTLAPGTPYDHPATALDWCPNCTTIRSDLAVAMQRVRELHRHRMGSRYYVCAECGDNVPYPCATRRLVDDDPWAFLRALDGGTE